MILIWNPYICTTQTYVYPIPGPFDICLFLSVSYCDCRSNSQNSPTLCLSVFVKLSLCDRTLASIFAWWMFGHIFGVLVYAIEAAFDSIEIHVLVQRLLWRGRKSYRRFAMHALHVQKLERLEEMMTLNDWRSTDKYRAFCSIILVFTKHKINWYLNLLD